MAQRELKLQTDIIKSVRADGGYGRKMSNQFHIGIPDLLLALHPFAPVLCEVKDLGPVIATFNRQLDVTPKQELEMERFNAAYRGPMMLDRPSLLAFALVGFSINKMHYLTLLPHDAERVTHECLSRTSTFSLRGRAGYYDLRHLFTTAQALRVCQ